jgi:hypothetical protein
MPAKRVLAERGCQEEPAVELGRACEGMDAPGMALDAVGCLAAPLQSLQVPEKEFLPLGFPNCAEPRTPQDGTGAVSLRTTRLEVRAVAQ